MPQSIQITETSPLLHDANCVYCHVDLDLGDQVVVCDSCQSPHHAECWQANANRCATFKCAGGGAIAAYNRSEAEQTPSSEFGPLPIEEEEDPFLYFLTYLIPAVITFVIVAFVFKFKAGFIMPIMLFLLLSLPTSWLLPYIRDAISKKD